MIDFSILAKNFEKACFRNIQYFTNFQLSLSNYVEKRINST